MGSPRLLFLSDMVGFHRHECQTRSSRILSWTDRAHTRLSSAVGIDRTSSKLLHPQPTWQLHVSHAHAKRPRRSQVDRRVRTPSLIHRYQHPTRSSRTPTCPATRTSSKSISSKRTFTRRRTTCPGCRSSRLRQRPLRPGVRQAPTRPTLSCTTSHRATASAPTRGPLSTGRLPT